MRWGQFLLTGDLAGAMDLGEQRRAIEQLRSAFLSQTRRDGLQEQQLLLLWVENVELKVTLNRMAHLLVRRGVLTPGDVTALVDEVGEIESGGPPAA